LQAREPLLLWGACGVLGVVAAGLILLSRPRVVAAAQPAVSVN
jgi:hypothetical protein